MEGSWTRGLVPPPLSSSLLLSSLLLSPSVSSKQAPARAPGQLFLSAGEEEREALPLSLALVQSCYRDRGKDTLCMLSLPPPFLLKTPLFPAKLWPHVDSPFFCFHAPHCSLFPTDRNKHPNLDFLFSLFFFTSVTLEFTTSSFPGIKRKS